MGERLNIILSTDQINSIEVCPTLYKYKSIDGKVPAVKASYFEAGELYHECLRLFYSAIRDGKKVEINYILDYARNWAAKNINGLSSEAVEDVLDDVKMYFDYYGFDTTWEIEGVEEPFAKILFENEALRIGVIGKADLRVKTNNGKGPRAIVDHKYEGRFKKKSERDNQPLCYSWAYETRDFIYNRIGKQESYTPDKRLKREQITYADYQIDQWKVSAIDAALDIIRFSHTGHWPMRMTGCDYQGNKCTYYDVCNTTESNREYKLNVFFVDRVKQSIMGAKKDEEKQETRPGGVEEVKTD